MSVDQNETSMPRVRSTFAAIALVLAFLVAGAASAEAASMTSDAPSPQLVRANLAANPGSVQIGQSRIRLAPGLIMSLPGRGSARAAQARGKACHRGYFCIYEFKNFVGASLAMSACKLYNLHSYRFTDISHRPDRWDNEASSWINNQTGGAVATLYSYPNGHGWWFRSSGRRDTWIDQKWDDNVESIRPC